MFKGINMKIMNIKSEDTKLIIAGIAGGIAGLVLGAYIWSKNNEEKPISSKLKAITKAIEQLENINTEDANSLKEKLNTLLLNLNSKYGKSEE